MNNYFVTPNHSVALNAKVGSSTLARAIIRDFHPEQEELIQTAAYPAGKGPDNTQVQALCPKEDQPTKPIVLLVRDPVERFRSAMAQVRLTEVEEALDSLENDTAVRFPRTRRKLADNVHFQPQHTLALGAAKVFRFPDHLEEAATLIGLTLPLPLINETGGDKPELTPEQQNRVRAVYAKDVALYESITTPGTEYEYDPVPLDERKAVALTGLERASTLRLTAGIEVEGLTLGATPADQAAFTNLLALLREAYDLQPNAASRQAFLATPQVIADIHGTPHTLPNIRALRKLLVAYGVAIRDLWIERTNARAAVTTAATRQELDAARRSD